MLSRLLKKNSPPEAIPAFTKKPFFRSEQKAFYGRLRRALPKCYVFPDVELRALMTPVSTDTKQRRSEKEYLLGRKVDYAVFDARLTLLCVIELKSGGVLDNTPGSNAQLLKSAGIRHFCWDKQKLPTSDQMHRMFGLTATPVAPLDTPDPDDDDEVVEVSTMGPVSDVDHSEMPSVTIPRATSLTIKTLDALAPRGHIKSAYPHVWERICMFCTEPNHLDEYLISLSVQERATKRAGFPPEVITEIYNIEEANAAFIIRRPAKPSWNDAFDR